MTTYEHKPWETELVSCVKHYEVNNDKCHNFYFLATVRIWTERNTYFRRRFMVWFDTDDLADWYTDKERFSKADIKAFARELAWNFVASLSVKTGSVTKESLQKFTADCAETIYRFNDLMSA